MTMILVEDIYVVAYNSDSIWKDALFTKEEAELERIIAEKETGQKLYVKGLKEHFNDLIMSYY